MKTIRIIGIVVTLLFLIPCVSAADPWKDESGKGRPGKPGFNHGDRDYRGDSDDREQERFEDRGDDRDHKRGPDDRGPDRFKERRGYKDYNGYRERPYDRGRHYGHYKHKRQQYEYQGHWKSWDDFDNYARKHPRVEENGHYYHDNAHLMFRFCEPGSGACFFFSIGK